MNATSVPPRSRGWARMQARHSAALRRLWLPLQGFLHAQQIGGGAMFAAGVASLIWANTAWSGAYDALWSTELALRLGEHSLSLDLRHWVNEGLMTLFFLSVGLEIKRELVEGELASPRRAVLPVAAAIGGMGLPALVYLVLASDRVSAGWAIPVATDIAFALAVLYLLGDRVETGVKVFLLAIAIVDDLAAIVIIAVFYSREVTLVPILAALAVVVVAGLLHRLGLHSPWLHVLFGCATWLLLLHSGVHATLAGVALALVTPSSPPLPRQDFHSRVEPLLEAFDDAVENDDPQAAEAALGQVESLALSTEAPLDRALRQLPPLVGFVVLPLFALANAGIPLSLDAVGEALHQPLVHGVVVGLVAGKPIGIFLGTVLAIKLLGAELPNGIDLPRVAAVGTVSGVGFTIAIFISELAFGGTDRLATAKLAILLASVTATVLGLAALLLACRRPLPSSRLDDTAETVDEAVEAAEREDEERARSDRKGEKR